MRTVLVTSADAQRRRAWAHLLERRGQRVLRCAGPLVGCSLLTRLECPLLQDADIALYDLDSVTPAFLARALRLSPRGPMLFARDVWSDEEGHRPRVHAVSERHLPMGLDLGFEVCFGRL